MKRTVLVTGLLALGISPAFAQDIAPVENADAIPFSEVDKNLDGKLSTTEAQTSLPELAIEDTDGDGMVSVVEAETAVGDLELPTDEAAIVGEQEYMMIVQHISSNEWSPNS